MIDDKEVATFEEDRLGHESLARELAQVVVNVPMPSNVALYGPWGSGKSGIGNMLEKELKDDGAIGYARFDAFKYAENPLRRNFVSVVATALGQKDSKYHADLYRGRTSADFSVPPKKLFELLGTFALVVFVCALVVSIAVSIVAATQGQNVLVHLAAIVPTALPASLVPATLLTALIALVGKTFVVERRVEKADSDEEFERLLTDLVLDSKARRIVIFVDELDRCAPADVVATLDAVRTFLGVPKCVFVVAADQQVLEQALTERAAQATPIDPINPYYSSGSAYLDKVFQYQFTVPPLMPQSITSYAVALVSGRPGVWSEVDVDVVVSILIPAHVRSPRRVKNLLNAFVLAYRLAAARHKSDRLQIDVLKNVDELAKLTCLRVEFPLFARDLASDPSLPEYVLRLLDKGQTAKRVWTEYPFVDPRVREIAIAYSGGERAVDSLLLEEDEEVDTGDDVAEVIRTQGQQLLDYLERTRLVTGAMKSLIFLQDSGVAFGLSATAAAQIERDAQNAALTSIRQVFGSFTVDQRTAAVDLLIQQSRSSLGVETSNISRSILALAATDDFPLAARADATSVVVAESAARTPNIIGTDTAVGAWHLALHSGRPEALKLGKQVLGNKAAMGEDAFFDDVVRNAARAISMDSKSVVDGLLFRLFGDDPSSILNVIASAQAANTDAILAAALPAIARRIKASIKAQAKATTVASSPATPPPAAVQVSTAQVEDELFDPSSLIQELAKFAGTLATTNKVAAQILLRTLLEVDEQQARDVVQSTIGSLSPVEDSALTAAVLKATARRGVSNWATWLSVLTSDQVASLDDARKLLFGLVDALWRFSMDESDPVASAKPAVAALIPLLDDLKPDLLTALRKHSIQLGAAVTEQSEIEPHNVRLAIATSFAASGLASPEEMDSDESVLICSTLEASIPAELTESPMAEYVIGGLIRSLRSSIEAPTRAKIAASVAACSWLSEFDLARATVVARTLSSVPHKNLTIPVASTIASYRADLSPAGFDQLLGYWLQTTQEPFNTVLDLVKPQLLDSPGDETLVGAASWQDRISSKEKETLVADFVGVAGTAIPGANILRAIGLQALPETHLAWLLTERFRSEKSNPGREQVLEIWALASPSTEEARRRLVRDVLIPMLSLNTQAARIALTHAVQLATPIPGGLRKHLGDSIVSATKGQGTLDAKGRQILTSLGYKTESRGLFGLTKVVKTDD